MMDELARTREEEEKIIETKRSYFYGRIVDLARSSLDGGAANDTIHDGFQCKVLRAGWFIKKTRLE